MFFDTWLLFCAAAFVVIVIPGPLSLLMVSNSLDVGVRRSWPAFLGGVNASLALLVASAAGLGALLAASASAFRACQIMGALYLLYLAWGSWRRSLRVSADLAPPLANAQHSGALFRRAFILGASNPKDLLFFAAFLPQFIQAHAPLAPQLLTMALTWACLDLACKLGYGLLAQVAAGYLRSARGQRGFQRLSAALFALAGMAALAGQRGS